MFSYASMCFQGDGIPENKKEAAKYCKMAADNGHKTAMKMYALMCEKGVGIPVNLDEARRYRNMANGESSSSSSSKCCLLL